MKYLGSILWPVCILILLFGLSTCELFAPPRNDTIEVKLAQGVPKDSTVAVDSSIFDNLVTAYPQEGDLVLFAPSSALQGVQTGDAIVIGMSAQTPDGLLKKAASVETEDGWTTVITEDATLEDAFEDLEIDLQTSFDSNDAEVAFVPSIKGVRMVRGIGDYIQFERGKINIIIEDVVLYDEDSDEDTKEDQILLNGNLSMEVSIKFKLKLLKRKLKFTITPQVENNLEISSSLDLGSFEESLTLGELKKRVQFMVGPVPVVVSPTLSLELRTEGSCAVDFRTSVSASASFTAGLKYEDRKWSTISESDSDFSYELPNVTGSLEAKASVVPGFSVMLYDVVGPSVEWEPYLRFKAEGCMSIGGISDGDLFTYSWALYAGHQINVGCSVKVLRFIDKDFTFDIPIAETTLISSLLPPDDITASDGEVGCVVVSWEAVFTADSYKVYRSQEPDTGYSLIADTDGLEFTDDTIDIGTTYYYRVKPYEEEVGFGPPSAADSGYAI